MCSVANLAISSQHLEPFKTSLAIKKKKLLTNLLMSLKRVTNVPQWTCTHPAHCGCRFLGGLCSESGRQRQHVQLTNQQWLSCAYPYLPTNHWLPVFARGTPSPFFCSKLNNLTIKLVYCFFINCKEFTRVSLFWYQDPLYSRYFSLCNSLHIVFENFMYICFDETTTAWNYNY